MPLGRRPARRGARPPQPRVYSITLRGVRCSPHFQDTLISVDQLWYTSGIDSVFRNVRRLVFTKNVLSDGSQLEVPFKRRDG
eukprot:1373456-Prymnesium_polylepis.1